MIRSRIGAHLQLTSGRPVLDPRLIPSLVRPDGTYPRSKKELAGAAREEIVREWHAQIAVLRDLGIGITHLDTHHHVHKFPHVFDAFLEIAAYYKLPARSLNDNMQRKLHAAGVPCAGRTLLEWYGGDLSVPRLLRILHEGAAVCAAPCTLEVMCHPGRVDASLPGLSNYVEDREGELNVLADPGLRARLADHGFILSAFAELAT
jgi:predicted glycoside hydrolase/deacetylase ChbG (UPF0249 family)